MPRDTEILELTHVDAKLFINDEGEFPTFITLITDVAPTEIVVLTVQRMQNLFAEFHAENSLPVGVALRQANALRDSDDNTHTVLTPDTLVLILDYSATQRLITLELGASLSDFTIH